MSALYVSTGVLGRKTYVFESHLAPVSSFRNPTEKNPHFGKQLQKVCQNCILRVRRSTSSKKKLRGRFFTWQKNFLNRFRHPQESVRNLSKEYR